MIDAAAIPAPSTAQRVADAVQQVAGVEGLHGGLFGEVATYLPGERISGVRIGETEGEVHLVVDLSRNVRTIAEDARAAAEKVAGVPVTVTVQDIITEAEKAEAAEKAARAEAEAAEKAAKAEADKAAKAAAAAKAAEPGIVESAPDPKPAAG